MTDATAAISRPRFARARLVLAGSMLVMGVTGMLYEYGLSALGNNLMGSSHEQIFVIIGLMMFAMGVGAAVQSKIGPPLIDRFLLIEIALGLLGGLSGLIVFTAYGFMPSYPVVLYGTALAIGLLVGFEVPLLVRINQHYSTELKSNLGEIMSMDYVGSLGGALLFAYVLLSRVPLAEIALAAGLASVAIAIAGLLYFWPLIERPRTIGLTAITAAAILATAWANAGAWVSSVEQRTYEDPIVHRETSVYQHLAITQRADHLRLYINGSLQFSSRDEHIYHELLIHPAMHAAADRKRVLILGGGDALGLREVLKYPGVERVVLVDLDPAVTRLAAEHPALVELSRGALLDARVSVIEPAGVTPGEPITAARPSTLAAEFYTDAAYDLAEVATVQMDAELFLRRIATTEEDPFNVIICDFPDPKSVGLAKLYSVGFYRRAKDMLAPGGIIAVQSTSPWHAPETFRCIGETLREAGLTPRPYRQNVPTFGEWGWHIAAAPTDAARLRFDSIDRLAVETRHLTPGVLRGAFEIGASHFQDIPAVAANTQMRPVIVEYYRRAWRR